MILIKLLFLILPIFVHANDDDDEQSVFSNLIVREHGIANVEELKTKWSIIENKIKEFSSKEVGKIMSSAMDQQGNISLPHVSPTCARDIMKTLVGLKKMEKWAFEMIDASGKFSSGMIKGRFDSMGDYDECVAINVKDRFSGKYCNVEIIPPVPKTIPYHFSNRSKIKVDQFIDKNSLIGSILHSYGNDVDYFGITMALCMPSTCKSKDIKNIGQKVLDVLKMNLKFEVYHCETKEDSILEYTYADIISLVALSSTAGLVIAGTILEICTKKSEKNRSNKNIFVDVLVCFSVRINAKKLMNTDTAESISLFRGMKVFSMLWVLLNHTYLFITPHAYSSILFPKSMLNSFMFQVVMNGYYSVSAFFFMSAVLLVYGRMKSKGEKVGFFHYVIHRVWRLLPPVLYATAIVFPVAHVGSGPLWNGTFVKMHKRCEKYWWHNVLFITNYVERSVRCIPWTWYLSVEMHLYLLSFFVIIVIKKYPVRGIIIISAMLIIGLVALVANQIAFELPPTVVRSVTWTAEDIFYYLQRVYYGTHVHIITYAIGLAVGFFIYWKPNLRIPTYITFCGYILSMGTALTLLYGVRGWNFDESTPPSMVISVLYACASKVLYSCCLAWVTITCVTGNCRIVNSMLSWRVFAPLSRVTYSVYMIHPIIQFFYTSSMKIAVPINHISLVYLYFAQVFASFLLAFVFSLMFESPFIALEKVIFKSRRSPKVEMVLPGNDDKQNNLHICKNGSEDFNIEEKNGALKI